MKSHASVQPTPQRPAQGPPVRRWADRATQRGHDGRLGRAADHSFAWLPSHLEAPARRTPVHDDPAAHRLCSSFGLEAFAHRGEVFFGHGRFRPDTAAGRALIRHELTHVVRGEGDDGSIEGWSSSGHRTLTRRALQGNDRYSFDAKQLLINTAPVPDYNRPQILQDMLSFWVGAQLWRAPLGVIGGGILGAITPPEQGFQLGSARLSGILPQAVLGTGVIPTVPRSERTPQGTTTPRPELSRTRVPQELANHGEDTPSRNEARQNELVDAGVRHANACNLYEGLVQLGYALHVAQDRGSHGDGYTASYVQNRPHEDIDDLSKNPQGVAVALQNSRNAIGRFFRGLVQRKQTALANPLSLSRTSPPVVETLLRPPLPVAPPPTTPPSSGTFFAPTSGMPSVSPTGVNILTVRF